MTLDYSLVLSSRPKEVALHLCEALRRSSSEEINQWLLEAVRTESLPPSIFSIWLRMASPESVAVACNQDFSATIRASAIHQVCKLMSTRGRDPSVAWTAFGGTQGLLLLLASFSVLHVKLFCHTLGGVGVKQASREERQALVTQLFQSLMHHYYPSAQFKSTDARPLLHHYLLLLPACDDDTAVTWRDATSKNPEKLQEAHMDALSLRLLDSLGKSEDEVFSWYLPLLTRFNGSTNVAIQTLRLLNSIDLDAKSKILVIYHSELAFPLIRKLHRRRVHASEFVEVLDLILHFFERNPTSADLLTLAFLGPIVEQWSRHEIEFTPRIERLLSLVSIKRFDDLWSVVPLLYKVRASRRFSLLRLILRLEHYSIDVDTLKGHERHHWPQGIFLALPNQDARGLLNRLSEIRNDKFLLRQGPDYHLQTSILPEMGENPSLALKLFLSKNEVKALSDAHMAIEEQKKCATRARSGYDRARHVVESVRLALAVGSTELLASLIIWCRRFNKDRMVVRALYAKDTTVFESDECLDLLCGVPTSIEGFSAKKVEDDIEQGNKICRLLLETAGMAVAEPSFSANDWGSVLDRLASVVELRLKRTARLHAHRDTSSTDLYGAVWSKTLVACLEFERFGLDSRNEKLGFNRVGGPWTYIEPQKMSGLDPSSLKFLDELAKQRDELWQQHRIDIHPPVGELAAPWPKGLPVQYLFRLQGDLEDKRGFNLPPYLLSRIESVVFMDSAPALEPAPNDDDALSTIGPFREYWQGCVELYIAAFPADSRRRAVERVWDHAVTHLSGPRMDRGQSVIFWKQIFTKAHIDVSWMDIDIPTRRGSSLPVVDDPSVPTRWNPLEIASTIDAVSTLPMANIDLMLDEGCDRNGEILDFEEPQQRQVGVVHDWVSSFKAGDDFLLPRDEDALVVAAMLLLGELGDGTRLDLEQPFPSVQTPRFPALRLDERFSQGVSKQSQHALHVLQHYTKSKRTPVELLARLSHTLYAALERQNSSGILEHILFPVLGIMGRSDRAHLTTSMVGRTLVDRPDNSSWHRQILTPSLLNRLSARNVQEFLSEITSVIQQRLSNQSSKDASEPPPVKVTTVKMVVELLGTSQVVEPEFAMNALTSIFDSTAHLDINVAVVGAWLELLVATIARPQTEQTGAQEKIQEKILSTLESRAIPLAASLNERRPSAQTSLDQGLLPEVYMENDMASCPPILLALIDACARFDEDRSIQESFVCRIIAPTLRSSAAVNQRFLELSVAKSQLNCPIAPPIPVKPQSLSMFINQQFTWVPSDLLDMWANYVLFHLRMDGETQKLIALSDRDIAFRESNEGQHWLEIHNSRHRFWVTFGGINLGKALAEGAETSLPEKGITRSQIHRIFMQLADAVILRSEPEGNQWRLLVSPLSHPLDGSPKELAGWIRTTRPIIEELLNKVEEVRRSRSWQTNPRRKPSVLPCTFELQMWLLPFPHMPWPADRDFANEVTALLGGMLDASPSRPYGRKFQRLKDCIGSLPRDWHLPVATSLGGLDEDVLEGDRMPTMVEQLRVALVASLLHSRASRAPDERFKQQALRIVAVWMGSADEEIRRIGLIEEEMLRPNEKR